MTAFLGRTPGAFDAAVFSVPGAPAPWERPGQPLVLGTAALLVALAWLMLQSYAINAAGPIAGLFSFAVLFSLAVFAPLFATVCLLAVTLYQNLLISILSPSIAYKTTYTILLGTNFLFTMMLCCLALMFLWRNRGAMSPAARRTLAVIRLVTLFATGLAPRQQLLLPIALGWVVANGVFQEEAFSPYALGLIALFCGVVYSNLDVLAAEKGSFK